MPAFTGFDELVRLVEMFSAMLHEYEEIGKLSGWGEVRDVNAESTHRDIGLAIGALEVILARSRSLDNHDRNRAFTSCQWIAQEAESTLNAIRPKNF